VPTASTQGTHAKGATYIVQDSVWTRLSAMLHLLLGLLLHACTLSLVWLYIQWEIRLGKRGVNVIKPQKW
jgi:formate hydrogenlyase subunit 3/multisubunit Na+/H+ antiporter MnhD subunit